MTGMTRGDWAAMALDAGRVGDALVTIAWVFRGELASATGDRQREAIERILNVAERGAETAKVLVVELERLRDAEPAPEGGEA